MFMVLAYFMRVNVRRGDHVWPLSALICVCFAQGPRAELGEPWFYVRFGKKPRHHQMGSVSLNLTLSKAGEFI